MLSEVVEAGHMCVFVFVAHWHACAQEEERMVAGIKGSAKLVEGEDEEAFYKRVRGPQWMCAPGSRQRCMMRSAACSMHPCIMLHASLHPGLSAWGARVGRTRGTRRRGTARCGLGSGSGLHAGCAAVGSGCAPSG